MAGEEQQVTTIRAAILFAPKPWPNARVIRAPATLEFPALAERFGDERILNPGLGYRRGTTDPGWRLPAAFWQEVRQLSFAFDDGQLSQILPFYRQYGQLNFTDEPFALVKHRLAWFRTLTILATALKEKRHGQLADYYWQPEAHGVVFSPDFGALSEHVFLRWLEDEMSRIDGWAPRVVDLYQYWWRFLADSVAKHLSSIPLEPLPSKGGGVLFGFNPTGALDAAFLQWYFAELANIQMPGCKADGCTNPVPANRRNYCSPQCMWRAKQQRHRERVKRRQGN